MKTSPNKYSAWVILTTDGLIDNLGGDLSYFGLDEIEKEIPIVENIVYLDGLLCLDPPPHLIENIEIDTKKYININITKDQKKTWILFQSRSEESYWKGIAQQKTNELRLLEHRISKTKDYYLYDILDILLIEQYENKEIQIISPVPQALRSLFSQEDDFNIQKDFPFLGNFIENCDDVWDLKNIKRKKSGPWIEISQDGLEYALEATALCFDKRKIILIEVLDDNYKLQHATLQHGRNIELIKISLENQIIKQNKIEEQLIHAKNNANNANLAKSKFLSSIGHELRAPLNAILGFSSLMLSSSISPATTEQRNALNNIFDSGKYLLGMIDQILELAKIKSGKINLNIEQFSPNSIIKDCVDLLKVLADERGLTISFVSETQAKVMADKVKLKQIVINLLSNAIKYNDLNAEILIKEEVTNTGHYRLSVRDEGPGVSPIMQKKLFEDFERLGKEKSQIKGTGIGLSITKSIVKSMNGRIGFENNNSKGCTFWIELERDNKTFKKGKAVELNNNKKMKVLVAEDNIINQKLITLMLNRFNFQVDIVSNGVKALDLLNSKSIKDYSLVFLDVKMPLMNGIETVKHIRNFYPFSGINIIGMSASNLTEDVNQCLNAGMNDFLEKPIMEESLKNILSRYCSFAPSYDHKNELDEEYIGDEEILKEIVVDFSENISSYTNGINLAFDKKDFCELEIQAHALKGICRGFKDKAVSELALQIELSAQVSKLPETYLFNQFIFGLEKLSKTLSYTYTHTKEIQ